MTRFLLDTNIVSAVIKDRGRHRIRDRVAKVPADRVVTSVIVAAEVRFGLAKKSTQDLRQAAEEFLGTITVLPFESPADQHYATLRADLERRGCPIGANDMLIAAHCLAIDATLVTNNAREFERVEHLRVEDWLII